jgi:hypothetical protein
MRRPAVVTLAPYIPLREMSERAAYALLLLHSAWGADGEAGLLGNCATAQERYAQILALDPNTGGFPNYVRRSLERRIASETRLADTGTPHANNFSSSVVEEFDELIADHSDEAFESPQFMSYGVDVTSPTATSLPAQQHGRTIVNCPTSQLAYLGGFVANMTRMNKLAHTNANVCTEEEMSAKIRDPSRVIEIENAAQERLALDAKVQNCNTEQRRCFDAARACISGQDDKQLVMFVSGEGGTGKSFLIHALTKYTQLLYGKTEGWFSSVLKTAPTGSAAFNIGGYTWHSALGKSTFQRLTKKGKLSDKQVASLQKNIKGVKLFILDEISLLSLEDLYEISFRLCTATGIVCMFIYCL